MNITIKNKKYVAPNITMGLAKDALELFENTLAFVDEANKIKDLDLAENPLEKSKMVSSSLKKVMELKERKCELLVRAYGHQFDLDELYDNITSEQVELEFNKIIQGINGTIEKNA